MHYMKNSESKKRTNVLDMTTGNPYSLMLRFAMPVFLSEVFQQLYNTADAFIVGRYLGTNALAAVTSSGNQLLYGNRHGRRRGHLQIFRCER